MTSKMATEEFKSPTKKLLRFFRTSRDQWKEKHHAIKRKLKLLDNHVRAVEQSRGRWRSEAQELRKRVQSLEREMARQK